MHFALQWCICVCICIFIRFCICTLHWKDEARGLSSEKISRFILCLYLYLYLCFYLYLHCISICILHCNDEARGPSSEEISRFIWRGSALMVAATNQCWNLYLLHSIAFSLRFYCIFDAFCCIFLHWSLIIAAAAPQWWPPPTSAETYIVQCPCIYPKCQMYCPNC